MTENQMMKKFEEHEIAGIWITAVALALLEKKFPHEKELWELVAQRAKIFIQKHVLSRKKQPEYELYRKFSSMNSMISITTLKYKHLLF